MKFRILFGVPEMQALWERLQQESASKTLSADDTKLYKRLAKAVLLLESGVCPDARRHHYHWS